jgi:hypothetical protein
MLYRQMAKGRAQLPVPVLCKVCARQCKTVLGAVQRSAHQAASSSKQCGTRRGAAFSNEGYTGALVPQGMYPQGRASGSKGTPYTSKDGPGLASRTLAAHSQLRNLVCPYVPPAQRPPRAPGLNNRGQLGKIRHAYRARRAASRQAPHPGRRRQGALPPARPASLLGTSNQLRASALRSRAGRAAPAAAAKSTSPAS